MRDIALSMIFAATLPFIAMRPHIGIYAWYVFALLNPHRLTWSFAFAFPFAQVTAIVTLLAWIVSREPKKVPLNGITVAFGAYWFWMTVSLAFALNFDHALDRYIENSKIFLFAFLTIILFQSRQRIHALVWVVALSIGYYGIKGGVFTILTGGEYMIWGPADSFIGSNNDIGLALIMVIPLFRYLQMQDARLWFRLAMFGAMGLCLFSVVATYSRGAVVGVVAMAGVLWWRSSYKLVGVILGGVALVAVLATMPDKWMGRVETIQTYEQDDSAMKRLRMWNYGISLALKRPLTGGGLEVFHAEAYYPLFGYRRCGSLSEAPNCITVGQSAHSNYFQVLGELGFPGTIAYLAILYFMWTTGSWIVRRSRGGDDLQWAADLARMLQVAVVGYAVTGLFVNRANFELFYALVALMAGTRVCVAATVQPQRAPVAPSLSFRRPATEGEGGAPDVALPTLHRRS